MIIKLDTLHSKKKKKKKIQDKYARAFVALNIYPELNQTSDKENVCVLVGQ